MEFAAGWNDGAWPLTPVSPETVILVLNVGWFGAAFVLFGLMANSRYGCQTIVPAKLWVDPLFLTLVATTRFLGGINSALCGLSGMILAAQHRDNNLFSDPIERKVLFTSFAVGHFSQFVLNVPRLWDGRQPDGALWDLTGTMLLIFIVDGLMFAANTAIVFSIHQ